MVLDPFRTEDLSDAEAIAAMRGAAKQMQRTSLSVRRSLLDMGFGVAHSMCIQLDNTAAEYTDALSVLKRMEEHGSDSD